MTTTSPDDNTSVPSRPVKATPEQLRQPLDVILVTFAKALRRIDVERLDRMISPQKEALMRLQFHGEAEAEILALFATFLASIELSEKIDWKKADVSPSDYNYAIGYNQCLRESQAIIDKLVEELHGR